MIWPLRNIADNKQTQNFCQLGHRAGIYCQAPILNALKDLMLPQEYHASVSNVLS